jgi:hypothetical protein
MNKSDRKYLQYCKKRLYKALKISVWYRIKYYWWRIFVYKPLPSAFSIIRRAYPILMAEKITSVQPMSPELSKSIIKLMEPTPMKPGNWGHEFMRGWFIVNEEGEEVYFWEDKQEYNRLIDKYMPKEEVLG